MVSFPNSHHANDTAVITGSAPVTDRLKHPRCLVDGSAGELFLAIHKTPQNDEGQLLL